MILSITCRQDTKEQISRSEIERSLSKYRSEATRVRVVFNKESHHKNANNLVTCHLSLTIPGKPAVDIYERQASEMLAFNRANERAAAQLTRRLDQSKMQSRLRPRGIQPLDVVTKEQRVWEA